MEGQLHRFSMHPKLQGGRLSGGWGVEMGYGISFKVFLFQIINSATSRTHTHTHTLVIAHTSSESSVGGNPSEVLAWQNVQLPYRDLAHLLRVVMEPKYYAMRFGLYTPSSDVIGSLGLAFWEGQRWCDVQC